MDKFKRQSIIVAALVIILAISAIGVPIIGAFELIAIHSAGISITKFSGIC